jgi:hypothetical protein
VPICRAGNFKGDGCERAVRRCCAELDDMAASARKLNWMSGGKRCELATKKAAPFGAAFYLQTRGVTINVRR